MNEKKREEKRRIENWTASRESKIKDASKETFWCAFFCVLAHCIGIIVNFINRGPVDTASKRNETNWNEFRSEWKRNSEHTKNCIKHFSMAESEMKAWELMGKYAPTHNNIHCCWWLVDVFFIFDLYFSSRCALHFHFSLDFSKYSDNRPKWTLSS